MQYSQSQSLFVFLCTTAHRKLILVSFVFSDDKEKMDFDKHWKAKLILYQHCETHIITAAATQ